MFTLEVLEEDKINIYSFKYNKEKINKVKAKIKDYSIIREIEITYDATMDNPKSYIENSPYIECDEYLGIINDKKNNIQVEENNIVDCNKMLYGGPAISKRKVKVKNYPILYNVLFGKLKSQNKNFINTILAYLTNDQNLNINTIFKFQNITYDNNIPFEQKVLFVKDIFNSFEIKLEQAIEIKDLEEQINIILSMDSYNSKKIDKHKKEIVKIINNRIKIAKENNENLNKILVYVKKLDNSKKQSKEKIKKI